MSDLIEQFKTILTVNKLNKSRDIYNKLTLWLILKNIIIFIIQYQDEYHSIFLLKYYSLSSFSNTFLNISSLTLLASNFSFFSYLLPYKHKDVNTTINETTT